MNTHPHIHVYGHYFANQSTKRYRHEDLLFLRSIVVEEADNSVAEIASRRKLFCQDITAVSPSKSSKKLGKLFRLSTYKSNKRERTRLFTRFRDLVATMESLQACFRTPCFCLYFFLSLPLDFSRMATRACTIAALSRENLTRD